MEKSVNKLFFELVSAATLTFIGRLIASILGLSVSIVIARTYGPDMTGFLGIVGASTILFAYPAAFGFQASVLRIIPEYRAKYSNYPVRKLFNHIVLFVLLMAVVSSLIFFLLKFIWSDFIKFDNIGVANLGFVIGLIIILKAVLLVTTNALRAFGFVKLFSFFQLFTPFVNLTGLLILIPVIGNLSPIYALVLSFLIPLIFSVVFINCHRSSTPRKGPSHSIAYGNILKISFPMMIAGYVGILASEFGVLFLGASSSIAEVGLYVIAFKISFIPAMVLKAINSVISPKISQLYFSGDIDLMFTLCRLFTFVSTAFAFFVLLVFFFYGEFLLAAAFGDEFRDASPILNILLIAQLINAITGSSGDLMQMTESEKKHRDITIYGAIVYLLAGITLILYIGALGLAVALVLAEIVWNGVALIFIFRKFNQLPLVNISEIKELVLFLRQQQGKPQNARRP
ncbi:oligosaccharide flippase family protein [Planktomarina temperata]|nr:oligosaccharide flippase family protein [Planktomarina temperata]